VKRRPGAEVLLPVVIALAALALAASELMTTFELTPPGGDPLSEQLGGDRHGYAMLLLAAFAFVALLIAVATGQRAAGWATAGFGVAALALFLIIDLPDAGATGDVQFHDFGLTTVEAVPRPGFWLEAAAALVLALAGIAFATQPPADRRALRRHWDSRRNRRAVGPADPDRSPT
jgi:hypothetical protein